MHREQPRESVFKPSRQLARKEFEPIREQRHGREAREHARQSGKLHRTHALRVADAERQIREIAARF